MGGRLALRQHSYVDNPYIFRKSGSGEVRDFLRNQCLGAVASIMLPMLAPHGRGEHGWEAP